MTRRSHRTWDAFHHRGDVLRTVVDHANERRDGTLPMHLPGVAETFGDELSLLAALQLKWHTRLAGRVDTALLDYPADLESAVLEAWRDTAAELAGVRAILDRDAGQAAGEALRSVLETGRRKDWSLLASMAGAAGVDDATAARVGRELEERARAGMPPASKQVRPTDVERTAVSHRQDGLLRRIRAVLAA